MNDKELLSEAQLDFLREMMNIAVDNAATAISYMLRHEVNITISRAHALPASQVPSIFSGSSLPVACVRMGVVGDVIGEAFFIVPNEEKVKLTHLVKQAAPGHKNEGTDVDLSILTEIGNIVAGVYLTAVHDFCKLSICRTVPALAIDMIQSLLDESLTPASRQVQIIVSIENEFIVGKHRIRNFFWLIPSAESIKTLVDSIGQARIEYIFAQD